MKKIILTLLFMSSVSMYAQSIEFTQETVDYGEIVVGSDGVREFEFKNTGTDFLIINRTVGSCGCTVPTYPKEPIAPGKTAKISVKYDTKRVGTFSKQIKVYSNATNANPVKLKVKGIVKQM